MKILQLLQKYWAILGVEPLQPLQKNHATIMCLRRLPAFVVPTSLFIFSLIFIGYKANTIDEYADAFYACESVITYSIFPLGIILWKVDSLFKLIEDIEHLIEQRMENPESKQLYGKLNENIEKGTDWLYFLMIQMTLPAVLMPNFIISFYLYFATDLGGDAFILPFPVWTPFDWRTPIGYLIIFTIEWISFYYMCCIAVCFFVPLFASCYIIIASCDEIKNDLRALNASSKAGENAVALMKRVTNIIAFHAANKQLAFDVDNIFSQIIVVFFIWALSTICIPFLVIHIGLERGVNLFKLIRPLLQSFWAFALLSLICEFGQMLTNRFDRLSDVTNDCDWVSFPKEIQKVWPIIMQNTQRPVVLRTFKNASCSRETFKRTVNGGFSYFMIFRRFR